MWLLGADLDVDRHSVGDDVVDGGAGAGLFDQFAEFGGGGVAFDGEPHRDPLVPVAHVGVQPEDAVQVDVAGDGGADLGQADVAGGGDVGQPGGQARGQRVQHELDRGGPVVPADQHRRVV